MSAMRTATVENFPQPATAAAAITACRPKFTAQQIPQKAIDPNTQTTALRQQTAKSSEKAKKTANCKSNKSRS